jgi:tetratricopeptide (TPR) repeat protein
MKGPAVAPGTQRYNNKMNPTSQTMRSLRHIVFLALLLSCGAIAGAGQISPSTPPPPPPPEPVFDPYHAQKSIEIGRFYLKKGKYEAAIDRFQEATHFQPNLAEPWKLMGEAYEKRHEDRKALESYKKYLEIFPAAEDASKVKKRIAKLGKKVRQEAAKRKSP